MHRRTALHAIYLICFSLFSHWASAQLVPGFKANGRPMNQGDTVTICVGGTIVYESTAQTGYTAMNWRFRNGTPTTGNSGFQTIYYATPGIDSTVQVLTQGNDEASIYIFVRVNETKPTANFSFAPNGECGDIPVVFTNSSTGNGLSYLWSFGDALTSNQTNPSHQFLTATGASGTQNFNVKLVVTNDQVCKDSVTKVVTVKRIPDASLGNGRPSEVIYGPFNGEQTFRRCENTASYEFRFTNGSTTTAIISQWTIHWGDGAPDSVFTSWPTGTIIRHTYLRGKSIMTVTAQGTNGCVGIKTYNVFLGTTPAGGYASLGNTSICAPNRLQFVLTGFGTNALGTTYRVTTSDGTLPEMYQHPPPDTFGHIFTVGSCGIISSSYSNAFSSTLFVENPCGSTTVSVVPIYVSGKPRANFTFSPNVCTGTNVLINNATAYGGQITPTGGTSSSCTNSGKQVWRITPSTGYTITSGSLGSVNGDPTDGAVWTVGSTFLYANFTTPGTYTIKLYVSNDLCGSDSITKTICVRTPPTASFTMNKREGCAPDTAIITNTSPIGSCGGETYNWSVAYQDVQNCGTIAGYSFVNGTSSSTRNAAIRFTQPGRYIITLTEAAIATGCTSPTFRDTFYVKAKPRVIINTISAVCIGNAISPKATVSNCYSNQVPTYNWTFTNGTPPSSTDSVPGPIQFGAVGNYPVSLSVENECGITTATATASVTNVPVANAGPDTTICSGVPIIMGVNTGNYTYSWSPATGLSNANMARPTLTFNYTGPSADTTIAYVLTASTGSNCSSKDTVYITVKRKPAVSISPASAAICGGGSTTLVATGATTYSWSPTTTLNTSTGDTVIASPTANTTYTVTGTLNGCTSTAQATISVTALVNVNAGPDSLVCNSSTAVQFTGTPAGGTWSGHPNITPGGLFNPNTAGNGIYNLLYTAGNGTCTRTDTLKVTVVSAATASAGNDSAICQTPGTLQLTGLPAGGTWSGSPLVTTAGVFNTNTPGTYSLIYRIGSGSCVARDTVVITVNGGITNNLISSNQSICAGGQPAPLNGQAISGGNGAPQYQWQSSTDSLSWTNIPGATAQNYAPPIGITQTIFYRRLASTSLCSGPQTNISIPVKITINPDAQAVFNPTTLVGCAPFNITPAIINLTPYNNAVSTYNWYVNGTLIGSGQTFPGYTMANAGDSITIKLVAISRFGCKNDSTQRGFKTIQRPVPAFTQSDSVGCGPLSITFTNGTPNAAQYSYQWDFGTGQTSTLLQPGPINFPVNPLSGDTVYTVRFKTLSQCDTITLLRYVRVKSKPRALFTPDRSTGCSSYNFTFTNTSRGNGNSYVWDFGDGSPLLPSNVGQVQHVFPTGHTDTFRVKLKATNECGTDSLIYRLVVQPISIRPDFAVNGNERYGCGPHTVHFVNNSQGGSTFKWKFGNGDSLLTYRNVDTIVYTYSVPGTYTITMQATNSCSDTMDLETITVYPRPTVAFIANPLIACFSDTIRFFNNSDTGLVNAWRFGDGGTSFLRNPTHVYGFGGSYRVWLVGTRAYPTATTCADSAYLDIAIRDTLAGSFTASDTVVGCTPAAITFRNNNRPSASTTWSFGDGGTATGDSVSHTYLQPGTYVVRMVSRGLAGCTYSATKTIRVTSPNGTLLYNGGYLCYGTPFRMEVLSNNTTQVRYVFGDGDSLTTTSSVVFHNYLQPGSYVPYAYAIAAGCQVRLVRGDTVKVDRLRTGFRSQQVQQCGSTTVSFTDTSFAFFGIQSRQWSFGDGTTSTLQNPIHTYTQSGTYQIRLRIVGVSGCADTVTVPVTVSVRNYPVSTIIGDTLACIGQPLSMTALVQGADPIASYNWDFGNGTTATGPNVTATYNTGNSYTVRLISRTTFGCADTAYRTIRVNASPIINAGPDVRICRGQSIQLGATGATTWQWSPLQNLSCTTCANPIANPVATTTYVVTGSYGAICRGNDTIVVEVIQPFSMTVSPTQTFCYPDSVRLMATGAYSYTWSPAASLDNPALSNPLAKPAVTTVYQVVGKDRYNCFTDTDYIRVNVGQYPLVNLGTGALVTAGTQVTLNPVVTNGPIVRYTWTPPTDIGCINCPRPTAIINRDITYKLEVENALGCTGSDTIIFRTQCNPEQLYIPNAFSPDGDGTNDILLVRGKGIAVVKYFRVFNRWGQLVFERSNINVNDPQQGWDGKINGKPAQPDVYVVTAEALCTGGTVFPYKGNVTLVR
jgi:gliding motility-associated-like protein